jgi:hypothetical protein
LSHVDAKMVALKKPGAGKLMLLAEQPAAIDATFDLRQASFLGLIGEAFVTLQAPPNRVLRVLGRSPKDPNLLVEVVLEEGTLQSAMIDFSGRILLLSLVISLVTATLVYYSLQGLARRIAAEDASGGARYRGHQDQPRP